MDDFEGQVLLTIMGICAIVMIVLVILILCIAPIQLLLGLGIILGGYIVGNFIIGPLLESNEDDYYDY